MSLSAPPAVSLPSVAALSVLRKRVRRQPLAVAGIVLLFGFIVCGIAAPWIAPYNPSAIDLLHRLQGPSPAHWAGTDELGRDTFSRPLWERVFRSPCRLP